MTLVLEYFIGSLVFCLSSEGYVSSRLFYRQPSLGSLDFQVGSNNSHLRAGYSEFLLPSLVVALALVSFYRPLVVGGWVPVSIS